MRRYSGRENTTSGEACALIRSIPDLAKPGCYVLLLRLPAQRSIRVGKLGTFLFAPGRYLYVGSALGGLARRLARYFGSQRILRWHIDYLLRFAEMEQIWYSIGLERRECAVSRLLSGATRVSAVGFGSSDCDCVSHLFRAERQTARVKRLLPASSGWRYLVRKSGTRQGFVSTTKEATR